MKLSRLEVRVSLDEGFSEQRYLDSLGYWTIGYGSRWILGVPVDEETQPISEATARTLLRAGLWKAALDAQELFFRFSELNDVRQEVLVNMAYNLGFLGLARFRGMRRRLAELDYEGAADEMRYTVPGEPGLTPWYVQTGRRAVRLESMMRSGMFHES